MRATADASPHSFQPNFVYGGWLARNGRVEEAIPYLEVACAADAAHHGCSYDLAVCYLRAGRFREAASHLRRRIEREPTAELHNLLGAAEEGLGHIEAGVGELQRAAEMDPTEKHVFDLGAALLRYQAYEQALAVLQYGASRHSDSTRMRVALGSAFYARGRFDEAVHALCQAVDLDPSDTRALYFLGQMHDVSDAMAAEISGRLADFAERFPRNAAANHYYGLSLWKLNQPDPPNELAKQVEGLLERAVELDPGLHEAHYHLGIIRDRFGRTAEAIKAYTRAVEAHPDYDQALYRLGMAYRRLGEAAKSGEALRRYRVVHEQNRRRESKQRRPVLNVE